MSSKLNPSNFNVVIRSRNMLCTKLTILPGTRLLRRLWISLDGTALGKAPSISRNRTAEILPVRHDVFMFVSRRCIASVVVRPGLPLKWFAGEVDGVLLCGLVVPL